MELSLPRVPVKRISSAFIASPCAFMWLLVQYLESLRSEQRCINELHRRRKEKKKTCFALFLHFYSVCLRDLKSKRNYPVDGRVRGDMTNLS